MSGNLASYLTRLGNPDDRNEILNCFSVEEKYFRMYSNPHGLVISLLNQVIYLHDKSDRSEWEHKLVEAGKIVRSYKFMNFMPTLTRMEHDLL